MVIENYNDWLDIEDDAFVWRYMSFEKLYDMVSDNLIYFSRLDFFEDPLEGLKTSTINSMLFKNLIEHRNAPTSDQIIREKKQWQQGAYASCWYLTENSSTDLASGINNHQESLAMWNLYTANAYSFVIKIRFKTLLALISQSLSEDQSPCFNKARYGKIEYLPFNVPYNKNHKPPMPSLVKHISFKHENELRFLLMEDTDTGENKRGIKLKLKLDINELEPKVEIYSHPDMHHEIFNMFTERFKSLNFNLRISNLQTKNLSL